MNLTHIILLAIVQGIAELLPVSSSAHVIVAEKWMGLDPASPEMTFLLVMLHTGTMFAVLVYFWRRWRKLDFEFLKMTVLATAVTGFLGLGLKKGIEKLILAPLLGESKAEIEELFKSLPLIAIALVSVGILIWVAGVRRGEQNKSAGLNPWNSIKIGIVQGLCLPFRGFSRSGATISTALLSGISKELAEDFSFALAVMLTPAVLLLELYRLIKASRVTPSLNQELFSLLTPGLIGMLFSFLAGLLALKWLSAWLEQGRWKYFGVYCMVAGGLVFLSHFYLAHQPPLLN